MKTPDPAYHIYITNSTENLKRKIQELNHTILNPTTPADVVIATAKKLKDAEKQLLALRNKQKAT